MSGNTNNNNGKMSDKEKKYWINDAFKNKDRYGFSVSYWIKWMEDNNLCGIYGKDKQRN